MKKCKCPINGCDFEFAYGILGWDSHIARIENHPEYHPTVSMAENRKRAFQRDFPEFFDLAQMASRRSSAPPVRHKSGIQAKTTPGRYAQHVTKKTKSA